MNNNIISYIIILIFSVSFFTLKADVINLNCHSGNNIVIISWDSTSENNLKEYIVQKSGDGIEFVDYITLNTKGSNSSYSVIDDKLYRSYNFFYRIKFFDNNNCCQYSATKKVVVSTSAITTTWGSLKAMFR